MKSLLLAAGAAGALAFAALLHSHGGQSSADPAQQARIIKEKWEIEENRLGWCEKMRDWRLAIGIATGSTCPHMTADYVFGRPQPDGHPAWVATVYAPTDATEDDRCAVGQEQARERAETDEDRKLATVACERGEDAPHGFAPRS
jgi:hypothetical protein